MWLLTWLVMAGGQVGDDATRMIDEPALPGEELAGDAVPVRIYIRNHLGKRYRLVEARVTLDGMEVVHETSRRGQELERAFSALETMTLPGEHTLAATLIYEARGAGGDDDRRRVQTVYPFTLKGNKGPASLHIVAHDRMGAKVPGEKRPVLEVIRSPDSAATPLPATTTPATSQNVIRPTLVISHPDLPPLPPGIRVRSRRACLGAKLRGRCGTL